MIYLSILLTLIVGFLLGYVACLLNLAISLSKKDDVVSDIKKALKLPQIIKHKPQAAIFFDEEPKSEEEKQEEEAVKFEERILKEVKPMETVIKEELKP